MTHKALFFTKNSGRNIQSYVIQKNFSHRKSSKVHPFQTRNLNTSNSFLQNHVSSQSKYCKSCKLLQLNTDFASANYVPLTEKLIRTAFRNQARHKHPDTDNDPSLEAGPAYYEIVEARDYLLENFKNPNNNHISHVPKTSQNYEQVFVTDANKKIKDSREISHKNSLTFQNSIDFDKYTTNDAPLYIVATIVATALYFFLKNSDLPPPDNKNFPKGDGRHERRRKLFEKRLKKEREEHEEWLRKREFYEEHDSVTISNVLPKSFTSIMAYDVVKNDPNFNNCDDKKQK